MTQVQSHRKPFFKIRCNSEETQDVNLPQCVRNNFTFKIIFKTLLVLGLLRQREYLDVGKCLTFVIVNFYCLFKIICNVRYTLIHSWTQVFTAIGQVTQMMAFSYIINLCLFDQRRTIANLYRVLKICSSENSKRFKISRVLNSAVLTGLFVLITLLITFSFSLMRHQSISSFVENTMFNWDYLKPPWALSYALAQLDNMGWVFVQLLTWGIQVTLIFTIESVRMKAKDLSELILVSDMDVTTLGKSHTDLFEAVQTLDETFQFLILIWLIEWVASFCFYVPTNINFLRYNNDATRLFLKIVDPCLVLFCGGVLFATLTLISGVTGMLNSAFNSRVLTNSKDMSIYKMAWENHLFTKLNTSHLHFRFLKCVVIDKNFVVGVLTAVVSYFMYLITIVEVKSEWNVANNSNRTINA